MIFLCKRKFVCLLSIFIASAINFSFGISNPALAEGGKDTYQAKCAGCHTIGGGKLVGPDLEPTKSWTDSKLQTEVKRMASMAGGLTDGEVTEIVSYLKNPEKASAESSNKKEEDQSTSEEPKPTEQELELPGSAVEGKELFFGATPLKNGGMSCIACHQSGGAQGLGPDLAGVSEKYKGRALVQACKQAPFKVMKDAYKDHAITEQEALNISKYLVSADAENATDKKMPITVYGGGFALVVFVLIAFGYRNRNKSVREKLKRK